MAKEKLLNWKQEDKKELKKAVNDFNKRVRKLKKTRKDKSFIPSEIDYEGTVKNISTRKELERVIDSLGRFKGKEAYKKVKLPSGQSITKWELEEIKLQQQKAKQRITKRMNQIKKERPEYFQKDMKRMGNVEYRTLEATLKSIENFGKKKPSSKLSKNKQKEKFEEAKARIENWGSSDFEMRRAIVYRENYYSMIEKTYSSLENYEQLKKLLDSIENPLDFYETLKALESGEKLKDISFMYEATPFQRTLNKLISELSENPEVDSETSEEGE